MSDRSAEQTVAGNPGSSMLSFRIALSAAIVLVLLALVPLAAGRVGSAPAASVAPPAPSSGINHVFVINLENKGYSRVWGSDSGAPYLSQTLRSQGVLLSSYYSIAHSSLPNYIAQISGQAPNTRTLKDCAVYSKFADTGTVPPGQWVGTGCVYPAAVPTVADQLTSAGKTWKGYMEDMKTPCRHPELGAADDTKKAVVGDQYAARHNPFVYFAGITGSPQCAANVVDLDALTGDLASAATTPNLSYITPNLCSDGHDKPCVDGRAGGLQAIDTWLKQWVPRITDSPAFRQDGVLVITFDESDEKDIVDPDAYTCCTASSTPVATVPGGIGGGLVGALVLSPHIKGGTTSDTVYNHYGLLASIEDIFSLPYLGYAGAFGQHRFGTDVYNSVP
ncbi:alkaline phosphatase family protein [Paenarthrobacter sp. PH39-S1]|uniref:alkaline phosphatase family protein n=1 Tax=Paenarthrobacter sp. PH39-S1 TaxID=3046204 RepID=UPI0024B9A66B|nr:alkaline phosphatase family protein [Paenarthrobacter sp. PH39-S1]MDJ0356121.1 alkaline phosphatase family protein [Paenarthrobacter sp. PH39-S1]